MSANDVQYRYFAVDSDHDISAATLSLSLDNVSFVAATYSPTTPPAATYLSVPSGLTRYWWVMLLGPGQPLVPYSGQNTVTGILTDLPELLHPTWSIYV